MLLLQLFRRLAVKVCGNYNGSSIQAPGGGGDLVVQGDVPVAKCKPIRANCS